MWGSSFHVVGKVLVEIFEIVVIEVETLCGITLRFFGDTNHEDFMAKVLNFFLELLGLVCLMTDLEECSVGRADPLAVSKRRWDLLPS